VISADAKQLADTLANAIAENQTGTAMDETQTFKVQLLKFLSNQVERAMLNDLIPFFRTGAFRFRDQKSPR
jgi:hypothetical protein